MDLSTGSSTSLSEYDTDEKKNEMEKNFFENRQVEPDDDIECDVNELEASKRIRERLKEWANKHTNNITTTALNELLIMLRNYGHRDLPKCAETLLGTNRTEDKIKTMKSKRRTDASYVYTGIESVLKDKIVEDFKGRLIELIINIDGLPLYNKSLIQLWPILIEEGVKIGNTIYKVEISLFSVTHRPALSQNAPRVILLFVRAKGVR